MSHHACFGGNYVNTLNNDACFKALQWAFNIFKDFNRLKT